MSKKKVYVETTVISDATALPTNDLAPTIKRICSGNGYVCPEICTPYQLQQDGGDE